LRRAEEIARQRNLSETVAAYHATRALHYALTGNCVTARSEARAAVIPEQGSSPVLALLWPLALCGDPAGSEKIADEALKEIPLGTVLNAVTIPSIRAAIALNRNQPDKAIELLQSAAPYERAYASAIYLRGLAYLRARKGAEATAEFQKILDHKYANWDLIIHSPMSA